MRCWSGKADLNSRLSPWQVIPDHLRLRVFGDDGGVRMPIVNNGKLNVSTATFCGCNGLGIKPGVELKPNWLYDLLC